MLRPFTLSLVLLTASGACLPALQPVPGLADPPTAASPASTESDPASTNEVDPTPSQRELEARKQADKAVKFAGKLYRDKNENPLVTACVPTGPEKCGDGIDNDCDGRYDDNGCGYQSGVLQWTVAWSGDADLDLVVGGPAGMEVRSERPQDADAKLILDRSCSGKCGASNIENVFVPADGAPLSGTYLASIEVRRPSAQPNQPIVATVSGRVGGSTWHNEVRLAPFVGAQYRVAFAVGVDSDEDGVVDGSDACPLERGCFFADVKYRGCADRDGDSVPDRIDACPDKTGLDSNDTKRHGCPLEFGDAWLTNDGVKILKRIEFATGTAELRPESRKTIADVARAIKAAPNPVTRMAINGHTDSVGDEVDNVALSFDRAGAVVLELAKQGVVPETLDPRGYGETKPLADNDTEAGRQTNRRVEFAILRPPPRSAECW